MMEDGKRRSHFWKKTMEVELTEDNDEQVGMELSNRCF